MDKQAVAYAYNEILFSNEKEETPVYPTAEMNLKCILISTKSQTQKVNHYMILTIW